MKNEPSKPPRPLATGKSRTSLWVGLGIVGILIIGIALFAFDDQAEPAPELEDEIIFDDTLPVDSNVNAPAEVKTIEVTGRPFEFSQEEIRVNQGDTVRIVFSSTQGFHDWVVDEFDAATKQVNPGTTTEVEFVADQAGTFEYYCSVGNHRQLGMVGTLIVE